MASRRRRNSKATCIWPAYGATSHGLAKVGIKSNAKNGEGLVGLANAPPVFFFGRGIKSR